MNSPEPRRCPQPCTQASSFCHAHARTQTLYDDAVQKQTWRELSRAERDFGMESCSKKDQHKFRATPGGPRARGIRYFYTWASSDHMGFLQRRCTGGPPQKGVGYPTRFSRGPPARCWTTSHRSSVYLGTIRPRLDDPFCPPRTKGWQFRLVPRYTGLRKHFGGMRQLKWILRGVFTF